MHVCESKKSSPNSTQINSVAVVAAPAFIGQIAGRVFARFLGWFLGALPIGQLVGPKAGLTGSAVDQRIGKSGDVAGGLPDLRVHQDGGVEAFDVIAGANHRLPPAVLDILLQLDAQGAVVPHRPQAPIYLGGLEDEPSALGQGDQLIHHRRGGHAKPGSEIKGGLGQAASPEAKVTDALTCRQAMICGPGKLRSSGHRGGPGAAAPMPQDQQWQ